MRKLVVLSIILISSICFADIGNINSAIKNGLHSHTIIQTNQHPALSMIYGGKDISKSRIATA